MITFGKTRSLFTLTLLALLSACCASNSTRAETATPETFTITVPSGGWTATVTSAHQVGKELYVIINLEKPKGMASMAIQKIEATAQLPLPKAKRKVFILGKTWNWDAGDKDLHFIASQKELENELKKAKRVYPADEPISK